MLLESSNADVSVDRIHHELHLSSVHKLPKHMNSYKIVGAVTVAFFDTRDLQIPQDYLKTSQVIPNTLSFLHLPTQQPFHHESLRDSSTETSAQVPIRGNIYNTRIPENRNSSQNLVNDGSEPNSNCEEKKILPRQTEKTTNISSLTHADVEKRGNESGDHSEGVDKESLNVTSQKADKLPCAASECQIKSEPMSPKNQDISDSEHESNVSRNHFNVLRGNTETISCIEERDLSTTEFNKLLNPENETRISSRDTHHGTKPTLTTPVIPWHQTQDSPKEPSISHVEDTYVRAEDLYDQSELGQDHFLCRFCKAFIRSPDDLFHHMEVHSASTGGLHCAICKQSFSNTISGKAHYHHHFPHLYMCPLCGQHLDQSDLKQHFGTLHPGEESILNSVLSSNSRSFHNTPPQGSVQAGRKRKLSEPQKYPSLKNVKSEICLENNMEPLDMNLHSASHDGHMNFNSEQLTCLLESNVKSLQERVVVSQNREINPPKETSSLQVQPLPCLHRSRCVQAARKKDMKTFTCSFCSRFIYTVAEFMDHVQEHQFLFKQPLTCPVCLKVFHNEIHLRQHASLHVLSKLYVCPVCGTEVSRIDNFKRHINMVHPTAAQIIFDNFDSRNYVVSFPDKTETRQNASNVEGKETPCQYGNINPNHDASLSTFPFALSDLHRSEFFPQSMTKSQDTAHLSKDQTSFAKHQIYSKFYPSFGNAMLDHKHISISHHKEDDHNLQQNIMVDQFPDHEDSKSQIVTDSSFSKERESVASLSSTNTPQLDTLRVFSCLFCGANISDKSDLVNHLNMHAANKQLASCPICFVKCSVDEMEKKHSDEHFPL